MTPQTVTSESVGDTNKNYKVIFIKFFCEKFYISYRSTIYNFGF